MPRSTAENTGAPEGVVTGAKAPARHESPPEARRYRVWAPAVEDLTLEVGGQRFAMTRGEGGWWSSSRTMRDGERYGYVVDGEGPFPDPRSTCQPDGVHGVSQVVDHGQFEWSDSRWQAPPLAAGIVYELHVGTFSEAGTFQGVLEHLPHLVDLGVTHVELMPIGEFSGSRGWGYDGVDLFAPHHAYGRPEDLKRLVDACHRHGLAVILDVVYNHLGPAGNYLRRYGPYFTHRYNTPWGDSVNLDDAGSDEVRRFFCDNAVMWLRDYHVDGLRLDAVHALIDTSAHHFLEQIAEEVDRLEAVTGRHFVLIAESDLNDPRIIRAREAGGFGIDAQWSDDFHHALHSVLTGERAGYYADFGTLTHLSRALREAYVYAGTRSGHRGRTFGRPARDLPGWRFVVAAQNHDQIGNRAQGERLSQLVSRGRLKIAAGLLLGAPFVPMLFQGEEWGASTPFLYFTSHEDDTLAAQVSEGRCKEFSAFGWNASEIPDPQAEETWHRSRLRWDEIAAPEHHELLAWHRALIALRAAHPSLRDGRHADVTVTCDEERGLLTVTRGDIVIACNLGHGTARVNVGRGSRLLLGSEAAIAVDADSVQLPPDSIAFLITSRASTLS